MSIETLAKQGREHVYTGLAGIDVAKLKKLRNDQLKECFNHFDDMHYRMEFVARIHETEFINDAASRSVNATWYSLDRAEGPVVWIAHSNDSDADYKNIINLARQKVRMLICIGPHSEKMHATFREVIPTIIDVETIGEAVHKGFYNDIEFKKVIYSPSCESELTTAQQGDAFTREVNEL